MGREGTYDLGREERDREVWEIRKLTLEEWVVATVAEEAWNGSDAWKMATAEPESKKTMALILSLRVRFLLAEGRGRRGEDSGVLSWLRGSSCRQRCGRGSS